MVKNTEALNKEKTFNASLKEKKGELVVIGVLCFGWLIFFWFLSYSYAFSEAWVLILAVPIFAVGIYLLNIYAKVREDFWKQLAEKYNWKYIYGKEGISNDTPLFKRQYSFTLNKPISNSNEKALIFNKSRNMDAGHGLAGTCSNYPLHVFEFNYSIRRSKYYRERHFFTVFEILFRGTFPHLYLNNKKNKYNKYPAESSLSEIKLPQELQGEFDLFAPKEYELEALEVFTPDVCTYLVDSMWKHDFELVNSELIIYIPDQMNSFADFDKEIKNIENFVKMLGPKLNRLKLSQIGDKSSLLQN